MFLLDTNVVSELRRPRPHGAVVAWLESVGDEDLHLSAVTIGEIQAGIEITREQDQHKAVEIETWLDKSPEPTISSPWTRERFACWARLMHRKPDHLIEAAMIAATASVHGLTVVTRNVRDFEGFDVQIFNPFEAVRE